MKPNMRFTNHISVLALALFAGAGCSTLNNGSKVELFNGENFDGWVKRGGEAAYSIEDGNTIVGTTAPNTPNTFLCTEGEYANFILEMEFKVDPAMNSGVQFRSRAFDRESVYRVDDREIKVSANRVHGYQFEIDPSDRKWTGGVYDEARRGWLFPLRDKPEAQAAFKNGEWNTMKVIADGPRIRTWVNGVPCADFEDDLTLSGFIALQVHGVGDRAIPMQIRWRNIRLTELR